MGGELVFGQDWRPQTPSRLPNRRFLRNCPQAKGLVVIIQSLPCEDSNTGQLFGPDHLRREAHCRFLDGENFLDLRNRLWCVA